tara:strand:- start:316261 stop:317022 length:762 start_codon:yes stop_codon:yes gene_type:complete
MKNILISILVLVAVGLLGAYLLKATPQSGQGDSVTHTLEAEGLVFTYKGGAEGYQLEEQDVAGSENAQLQKSITLTPTKDYEDQKTREGGEGSPSWHLTVYRNDPKQSPSVWVDANPSDSNIRLATGPVQEAVVGGANAVAYTIDGLYMTDVVVIANGGLIFMASGAYENDTSATKRDFASWIESFKFIPTAEQMGGAQGKIDIDAACKSALAYSTFENGEDADRFVAECKEGKHPDVIERYLQGLGVDGAVI